MRKVTIILFTFLVSCCISIETPKHLVSDTIQAGKDVYDSLTKDEETQQVDMETEPGVEIVETEIIDTTDTPIEISETLLFNEKYLTPDNESYTNSNAKCLEMVIESARKKLNVYNLDIVNSRTKKLTLNDQKYIKCEIDVSI